MRKTPQLLQRSVAALASLALIWPSSAFAATSLSVNGGDPYTEAASGAGAEGGTWSWAGPDGDLTLDGYQDSSSTFVAVGDLIVALKGDNAVYEIRSNYGYDLSLIGEDGATLAVGDGQDTYVNDGIFDVRYNGQISSGRDLTIENLDITLDEARIRTQGSMSVTDSSIDGQISQIPIDVNYDSLSNWDSDTGDINPDIPVFTVSNSHIHVVNTAEEWRDDGPDYWPYMSQGIVIRHATTQEQYEQFMATFREYGDYRGGYGLEHRNPNYEKIAADFPEIAAQYDIQTAYETHDEATIARIESLMLSSEIFSSILASNSNIVFDGVEGDTTLMPLGAKSWTVGITLWGDNDYWDTLIDPIPEPEPEPEPEPTEEEPTPEPTPTPEPEPTPAPAPAEEQTTPEPEPEPEVVNPVEEAPAPAPEKPAPSAPAPSGPQLPKTDDASNGAPIAAMAAGGVSALLAGSVLLRRRPQE